MRKRRFIHGGAAVTAAILTAVALSVTVSAIDTAGGGLCVGGMPFGVRFQTDGVIVAGIENVVTDSGERCPARDAGIAAGDIILAADGVRISSADELVSLISDSDGGALKLTYRRGGKESISSLTPVKDKKGSYRAGMWVRDSAAGIGTITFYDPGTGEFAGLGHGICDSESGELIPLVTGRVTDVSLFGIERGIAGTPGELKGYFGTKVIGSICKNSLTGVYGTLTNIPAGGESVSIAGRSEIKAGEVKVRCTLADGEMRDYTAVISEINRRSRDNKSFIITITDPVLIEKTGGIIQGMSGSPILQDGKLIGAVTHVMINDPSRGYGIFIENMLENVPARAAA